MRNVEGKPYSTPQRGPWHLAHNPAKAACQKIGRDLPTNDLWQALVRNAEKQPVNWESGHMNPDVTLSNGATFYHVGDWVWEQVEFRLNKDPHINGLKIEKLPDKQGIFCRIFGFGCQTPKDLFGPAGTYKNAGLGVATTYYKGNPYIMRGGDDQDPGLFGVAMNHGPDADSNGDDVGFRCACPSASCK